ncbi:DUF4188 domain-containing protein [Arthrobacter sp. NPDC057259]|uniref:DUF4188 domain-containing protein n=1 Tax=Arthrobacter sp. NPDC057259 TaxID=3346073 RepID=UPI00362E327A
MTDHVHTGRFTAAPEGPVTVFLIGMRANRWWKLGKVAQVAASMPTMLGYLARTPEAGLLGYQQWFGRTTIMVTYWKSPEHLQRFAADRSAPHLEPWRRFMRESAGTGDVGIWHETYETIPGGRESMYSDMPAFGLAAATGHAPVGAGLNTARQRLEADRAHGPLAE